MGFGVNVSTLRYVGNAKWHISRKLDMGGSIPASRVGFNRFLVVFEPMGGGLNLVENSNDVGCEVDGHLSGDLNPEDCTFIE